MILPIHAHEVSSTCIAVRQEALDGWRSSASASMELLRRSRSVASERVDPMIFASIGRRVSCYDNLRMSFRRRPSIRGSNCRGFPSIW